MDWADNEFSTLSLGDKRLNARGKKALSDLSRNPSDSIPATCRSAAETKATYRFFDHKDVTSKKVHKSHVSCTLERISKHPIVLVAQDTTVLNFTTQKARTDTGPTVSDASKGVYLHPSLVITPEKVSLGILSYKQWHRKELQHLTKSERTKRNYARPIESKESYRWLEQYKSMTNYAKKLPGTVFVNIADREADIYELYAEANFECKEPNAHYIIRAKYNRQLCTGEGKKTGDRIKEALLKEKALGEFELKDLKDHSGMVRTATLELYTKRIWIEPPKNLKEKPSLEITAILCREKKPRETSEKVEWLLITDLCVEGFEEAYEKVKWYCCRWQIEIFFKALKSGCKIEKLQLSDGNFDACLVFYMIIAWRILFVTMVGRAAPNVACDCVFSQEEWETTYVVLNKKKPPVEPPTLNEMIIMVASLGGYLNRKSDPPPGIKALWLGLRNMQEHLRAREAFFEAYGGTYG